MINICIPYRNMPVCLEKFLSKIKVFDKNVDIKFLIVEQSDDNKRFNLGKLINVGFDFYNRNTNEKKWIFGFNPIDMIPLEGIDIYIQGKNYLKEKKCNFLGYHYQIEQGHYKSFLCSKNNFIKLNGFTNNFWGYGAEDNEIQYRLILKNMKQELKKINFYSWGEVGEDNLHFYHSPDALLGLEHHETNLKKIKNLTEDKIQLDGLSTLSYNIIDKQKIYDNIDYIKVNI